MFDHESHDSSSQRVDELVAGARRGEGWAWSALVERYRPLVRAVSRGYRLNDSDAEDVGQTVWMRLVEYVDRIREPRALPRWLIRTASHESLRLTRSNRRFLLVDPLDDPQHCLEVDDPAELDADLLRTEQVEAVRMGLSTLPPAQRHLLELLTGEQPLSYREISSILGIPMGSIGPTRARGLARLSAAPVVRTYLDAGYPGWVDKYSA